MGLFDRAVEALILVGVWIGVYLEWKTLSFKRQAQMKRRFNKIMQSVGI